jgi:hypothetical protein
MGFQLNPDFGCGFVCPLTPKKRESGWRVKERMERKRCEINNCGCCLNGFCYYTPKRYKAAKKQAGEGK